MNAPKLRPFDAAVILALIVLAVQVHQLRKDLRETQQIAQWSEKAASLLMYQQISE